MNEPGIRTDDSGRRRYEEFLLHEYDNIAQAHFNTVNTIATFFKHYLLIVSLPIPLLAWVLKPAEGAATTALGPILQKLGIVVPLGAILIGVIGFLVMCYIANLRFDAILYARTVNGIRKYFSSRSTVPFEEEFRVRVLPRSTYQPRYLEWTYFIWVILAFGLLNATYVSLGLFLWCRLQQVVAAGCWAWAVVGFVGFAAANIGTYAFLAWHRESRYLRSHIIGLDIDGVLNRHREHFCKLLGELRGKSLDPESITRIPVHECAELKDAQGNPVTVSEEDAHAIFNHPEYWRDMPAMETAAEVIQRLKNILRYKIVVFTHRPWPHPTTFPKDKTREYSELWRRVCWGWARDTRAIRLVTKTWLDENKIPCDRLVVEAGNIHTTDPGLLVRNRFVISERKSIRVFVEDDLFKARKLAHTCELVFILDQPYNRCAEDDLPNNVRRVRSWHEVYDFLREKM